MTELILQLAALALTAVLASIGITQEYRHKKTGKITRWGMIALLGAVLTFMFSVALQVLQTAHNDKEKRLRDAATQQQLNEIRRAVYATTGLRAAFAIVYPLATDGSSVYRERLAAHAKAWRRQTQNNLRSPGFLGFRYQQNALQSLTFMGSSTFAPRPSTELDESTTIDLSSVSLDLFVHPISGVDSPEARPPERREPDLRVLVEADARRELLWESYDVSRSEITVWIESQQVRNYRNASVRSVQDLVSARLVITLPNTTSQYLAAGRQKYVGRNNEKNMQDMRSRARLRWLVLQLTDWGSICLTEEHLKRLDDARTGIPQYVIDLPNSLDKLRKLYGDALPCTVEY